MNRKLAQSRQERELEETAERLGRMNDPDAVHEVFVDAKAGNDANAGGSGSPVKSLAAAMSRLPPVFNSAVSIQFSPGSYDMSPLQNPAGSGPLTLKGATVPKKLPGMDTFDFTATEDATCSMSRKLPKLQQKSELEETAERLGRLHDDPNDKAYLFSATAPSDGGAIESLRLGESTFGDYVTALTGRNAGEIRVARGQNHQGVLHLSAPFTHRIRIGDRFALKRYK